VRSAWGAEKKQPLNEYDELVLMTARDLGGLPAEGDGRIAFWKRLADALAPHKKAMGKKPYKDYRGARAAYWRARDRLASGTDQS
ncbi:MAG: hypothetical protein ACREX3_21520, partial [Gammaproteobacteria bacterium]